MSELFLTPLESPPPRLQLLRKAYDAAQSALDAAETNEDETGEPIPSLLRREFYRAERQLTEEEARIASELQP